MTELTFNSFFAIQSVLSINMKSPIRKLSVLTNQSSSGSLITFPTDFWPHPKEWICKNTRNIQDSTFADIYFSDFSSFIFKVPVEKVVIDEEELHDIVIDGILNLKNLSRTFFID